MLLGYLKKSNESNDAPAKTPRVRLHQNQLNDVDDKESSLLPEDSTRQ